MRLIALLALLIVTAALMMPNATRAQVRTPLRVAFLGDSLTLGLSASTEDRTYREIFLRRLSAESGRTVLPVVVDPFGMTDDALRRLPPLLAFQPDLVIVELGNHEVFAGSAQIDLLSQRYDQVLVEIERTGATVIAGTTAWLNYPAGSRLYSDALRVNEIIRRLCAARGIAIAELWGATVVRGDFISSESDPSFYPPFRGDDLHPNDAGHLALADTFWSAFLRDRARRVLTALAP